MRRVPEYCTNAFRPSMAKRPAARLLLRSPNRRPIASEGPFLQHPQHERLILGGALLFDVLLRDGWVIDDPVGIHYVFVNGHLAIDGQRDTDVSAGHVLRQQH